MGDINWKDKCWVTTIFLVRDDKKVLLTWNKNLQTWIPVGGHIDHGETPEQALKREVRLKRLNELLAEEPQRVISITVDNNRSVEFYTEYQISPV